MSLQCLQAYLLAVRDEAIDDLSGAREQGDNLLRRLHRPGGVCVKLLPLDGNGGESWLKSFVELGLSPPLPLGLGLRVKELLRAGTDSRHGTEEVPVRRGAREGGREGV